LYPGNDHIIKKQSVVIEFHDRREGMGLQNKIEDVIKDKIIPRLNELFSEIAGPDKYMQLDELLIDAGDLSPANWEDELVENTIRRVKEKLRTQSPYKLQQEEVSDNTGILQPASGWDVFIHFLQFGYIPWFASNIGLLELEEQVLNNLKTGNISRSEKLTLLQQKLLQEKNCLLRFIFQFSHSFVLKIIAALSGDKKITPANYTKQLVHSFTFISANTRQQLIFLIQLFQLGLSDGSVINESLQHIAGIETQELYKTSAIQMQPSFYRLVKKRLIPGGILAPAQALVELLEQALSNDAVKAADITDLLFEQVILPNKKNKKSKPSATGEIEEERSIVAKTTLAEKENNKLKKTDPEGEDIFISNAGLVILHPFLGRLFRALEITGENNDWLQPSFQTRAVLITQYLVTGTQETDEHLLVLNKLLCGYPEEAPMERLLVLTVAEKEEINSLLQTVIKYWEALKNTSVDGLRNTFLIRDGKLAANENGSLLQVEQKAWDVLMDTLPWGTAMIKTPWMDNLLRVEWG
jgi:hypothetical protein